MSRNGARGWLPYGVNAVRAAGRAHQRCVNTEKFVQFIPGRLGIPVLLIRVGPLLLGQIDFLEVTDTHGCLRSLPGFEEVRDSDRRQQQDQRDADVTADQSRQRQARASQLAVRSPDAGAGDMPADDCRNRQQWAKADNQEDDAQNAKDQARDGQTGSFRFATGNSWWSCFIHAFDPQLESVQEQPDDGTAGQQLKDYFSRKRKQKFKRFNRGNYGRTDLADGNSIDCPISRLIRPSARWTWAKWN